MNMIALMSVELLNKRRTLKAVDSMVLESWQTTEIWVGDHPSPASAINTEKDSRHSLMHSMP